MENSLVPSPWLQWKKKKNGHGERRRAVREIEREKVGGERSERGGKLPRPPAHVHRRDGRGWQERAILEREIDRETQIERERQR